MNKVLTRTVYVILFKICCANINLEGFLSVIIIASSCRSIEFVDMELKVLGLRYLSCVLSGVGAQCLRRWKEGYLLLPNGFRPAAM